MSTPKAPDLAKLVVGFFTAETSLANELAEKLTSLFGPVERESEWLSFDYTAYYQKEMGKELFRKLVSFKNCIAQDELAGIKLTTNEIEKQYITDGNRRVNLDPGYLLRERFVLATGKNYAHRVYIGNQIYADVTLLYKEGGFEFLPWTYPDYKSDEIQDFLKNVRNDYVQFFRELKE